MKRVTIEQAKDILNNDNTYRKDVYLVQNNSTKGKYCTTGKIGCYSVCRVDRSQCNPNSLGEDGFRTAFVPNEVRFED